MSGGIVQFSSANEMAILKRFNLSVARTLAAEVRARRFQIAKHADYLIDARYREHFRNGRVGIQQHHSCASALERFCIEEQRSDADGSNDLNLC